MDRPGTAAERGVTEALHILIAGIHQTMKLLGCGTVRDLDRSFVKIPW